MTIRDAGRVVVVGGGLAGYSAAAELRALGHAGPIILIDPEPTAYDRPPLSKDLFADSFDLDRLAFADAETLRAKEIETLFGREVVALDAPARTVTLDDGAVLEADTILLATGGRARELPIPGAGLPGVLTLRTFADAAALRDRIRPESRVAVVGAGLIGAELASALLRAGAEVTLVDPVALPLVPAIGELMAGYLHGMHARHGIVVHVGLTSAIEESAEGLTIVLGDGTRIDADTVVVGIGIVPNSELAARAGIATDNGILVDGRYETSAPGVYAAGDAARTREADGTLHRREEHWEAAQLSGKDAAAAILGREPQVRGAGWFWSDRHGIHLEAVGRLSGSGEIVVREGVEHPAVFLIEDGLLVGAASIDDNLTVRAARRLIDQRVPVSAAELADPSVALRSLLRAVR